MLICFLPGSDPVINLCFAKSVLFLRQIFIIWHRGLDAPPEMLEGPEILRKQVGGKSVLVLGGTGRIVRILVPLLCQSGAKVRYTGRVDKPVEELERADYLRCKLPEELKVLPEKVDIVINLVGG